jgi:NAD(P)-dependent dehydrogenase (short-subunit alcohol dehydrogenase family)
MSQLLEGAVAVVTGGNSGIGLTTAKLFAAEGAKVVITGRRQSELDKALAEPGSAGLVGIQGDVSNLADLDRLYAEIKAEFGRIDVLFANAGVASVKPFEQVVEADFDYLFDVNVKGLFFTVQKALPLLKEGASVILNASIAGVKGMPNWSVYAATKAAVRSFARTWTSELASRKIRVNVLSPGPITTPIFGKLGLTEDQQETMAKSIAQRVPLGRTGEPEEIAAAALFLASKQSSFVAGIELFVDGGIAQV